jgi:hypothetical protein
VQEDDRRPLAGIRNRKARTRAFDLALVCG